MRNPWPLLVLIVLLAASCGSQTSPESTAIQATIAPSPTPAEQPTNTPEPAVEPTSAPPTPAEAAEPVDHAGLPLPTDRGELFTGSGVCAACHTQMVDGAGNDISIDTFWRASMMANSARDPYWQASVRGEVLSNPDYRAIIEDKCATCHTAMAHVTVAAQGEESRLLDDGFLSAEQGLHSLAMDGVSCNVCHQIRADNLGEQDSYSGGFVIDTELPMGERESFGPYQVGRRWAQLMQSSSGYVPVRGPHTSQPELCATCHTLYTPYVDTAGEIAGEFPEQMPFLEWQASSFGTAITCQDCHMPPAKNAVRLSTTGGPPREPFSQHIFVGGNTYMLQVLEAFGEEIATTASSAEFRDKQAQAAEQLQKRAASISLKELSVDDSTLTANVAVASMVGHKLPTGFPSRRVWLHFVVQDANGQILFESGAVNPDGSIVGNDNDADPRAYEPHYLSIASPDQVQVYETIMGDTEDQVTTTLLRGARYLKDNRLLPSGLDKTSAPQDIAVQGAALEDPDFVGAGDRLQYIVDVGDAQGPFAVTVELLYQAIGFRWAENLRAYDAPEPNRFIEYYDQVPNQPVVIASTTAETRD